MLREWPPGYGGVERVAHALVEYSGGVVFSLRRPAFPHRQASACLPDVLPVHYKRIVLPALAMGRLLVPWPSPQLLRLITSRCPVVFHLPCPAVLGLILLTRLLRPGRVVIVYWHAFLSPRAGLGGRLEQLYQWLALKWMPHCRVVSTSPVLLDALGSTGVPAAHLSLLPCCLLPDQEACLQQIAAQRSAPSPQHVPCRVIAIGRLDSYKRIDWLIEAIARAPAVRELHVVGDGPKREQFEALATRCLLPGQYAVFHGQVSEAVKYQLLAQSDLLVLASGRCNEAFGIVQLEAMASGLPAIALQVPRSGMFWVSNVYAIPGWNGLRSELSDVISQLFSDPELYLRVCLQARARYQRVFARALWEQRVDSLLAADG